MKFHRLLNHALLCFSGVLPTFQVFLKKMQHDKPMVHALHAEMVLLVRELSKFMQPAAIPLSVRDLLKLDLQSRGLQIRGAGSTG